MYQLVQLLVPIGICVVLPVLIVWIVCRASSNRDNKRAEVLIEAIKANNAIDATALAQAFSKPPRSQRELLSGRLLRACIFGLVGLVLLACPVCAFALGGIDLEDMIEFLMIGLVLIAVGVSYLIVFFFSRREMNSKNSVSDDTRR